MRDLEETETEDSENNSPLIPVEELFSINNQKELGIDEEFASTVWGWYAKAMQRRDRESLEEDRFINHFLETSFDPTFAFGSKEKGFLLGYQKYGVFIPTHFAPATLRGGYDLMKNLGQSKDVPACVSITDDLAQTLSKMPSWTIHDLSFLSSFRGENVEKKIAFNSHPSTKQLLLGLLEDYLEENGQIREQPESQ
jgi:hypothetical protein